MCIFYFTFCIKPAMDFGYNCMKGSCDTIPTGENSLQIFIEYPWLVRKVVSIQKLLLSFNIRKRTRLFKYKA